MKSLPYYIQEKLLIRKNKHYNYFPKTKRELQNIINHRIENEGNEVDLNDIDVSEITDMSGLFKETDFNGDISSWDVSNVTNMSFIFWGCEAFNQDISKWDVSNVIDMQGMFCSCKSFNQDISNWDVSNVKNINYVFVYCPLEEKYKPKFK